MDKKRLVIFNGSPRRNGTSYSFALTIKKIAEDQGSRAEIIHIIEYLDGKKDLNNLKSTISESDIIILSTALYVDTLPYPVIWFFESIIDKFKNELYGKCFFAVSQCAFPDVTRCEPLLGSCRCFAEAVGMNWLGGLAYGGGVIIDGALLENLGTKGKKITAAFKLAMEDVLQGRTISSRPQDMLTIRIPTILYYPIAALMNLRTRMMARKQGVKDIERKVYLE